MKKYFTAIAVAAVALALPAQAQEEAVKQAADTAKAAVKDAVVGEKAKETVTYNVGMTGIT